MEAGLQAVRNWQINPKAKKKGKQVTRTGCGFTWHHIEMLRKNLGLQNSIQFFKHKAIFLRLRSLSLFSFNFYFLFFSTKEKDISNPRHCEDREVHSRKGYFVPTESNHAFHCSCLEFWGPGHAGHTFSPSETIWTHMRMGSGWCRGSVNPFFSNRKE